MTETSKRAGKDAEKTREAMIQLARSIGLSEQDEYKEEAFTMGEDDEDSPDEPLDLPEIIYDENDLGSSDSNMSDDEGNENQKDSEEDGNAQPSQPSTSSPVKLVNSESISSKAKGNVKLLVKEGKTEKQSKSNDKTPPKEQKKSKETVSDPAQTVGNWLSFDEEANTKVASKGIKAFEESTLAFNSDDNESDLSEIPEDFFGLDDEVIAEPIPAATPKPILNGKNAVETPTTQKKTTFREPLTDVRLIPGNSPSEVLLTPLPFPDLTLTPAATKKSVERSVYEGNDDWTMYLIRKPKELTIEDLNQLKLPIDSAALRPKKLKIKKDEEKYEAEISTFGPQLLHADEGTLGKTDKGKRVNLHKIDNKISATILIKPKLDLSSIGPIDGEVDEDLPIVPIRREPMFPEDLKERLVPFGLKRKSRRSLPGLSKKMKLICKE